MITLDRVSAVCPHTDVFITFAAEVQGVVSMHGKPFIAPAIIKREFMALPGVI